MNSAVYLEVLPAYWGIETICHPFVKISTVENLKVLPAYWGIETVFAISGVPLERHILFGSTTRLLGY